MKMNRSSINILSIDFDYFVNATMAQRVILFPDCGNEEKLAGDLRDFVWGSRYATEPELSEIGILGVALATTVKAIKKSDPEYMWVADSHKHCYDFVLSMANTFGCHEVNITNVDFHHDIYRTASTEINCGNWLFHLLRNRNLIVRATWLARSDSDRSSARSLKILGEDAIGNLLNTKWDGVYICRSDLWSPPHLDRDFIKAFKSLTETDKVKGLVEESIFVERPVGDSALGAQIKALNMIGEKR